MMWLAISVEQPLNITVQGLHHADPRMHHGPATLGRHEQSMHRSLPFLVLLLGFRKLHDVVSGVLQREKFAAVRQRDGVFEVSTPVRLRHDPPRTRCLLEE
jgi:hypothetical protein